MDLSQLRRLGITLPPQSAFAVELSVHDREIITFWLLNRLGNARYVSAASTLSVAIGTVAAVISAETEEPRPFSIQNNSTTANLWLGFGSAPNATTRGIKVPPGSLYESPWDFKEAVYALSSEDITATVLAATR